MSIEFLITSSFLIASLSRTHAHTHTHTHTYTHKENKNNSRSTQTSSHKAGQNTPEALRQAEE